MIIEQHHITRFFSHTKQNENGCLEWHGNPKHYPSFSIKDKSISAHRFAWIIKYGPIPEGLIVCHSCDNKICVAWQHLWLGTHQHNAKDRNLKGRQRKRCLTASQEEKAANIFYTTEKTQKELSQEYNISAELMSRILHRKKFKDLYGKKTIIKPRKITDKMRQEILQRHRMGESRMELAKSFNVTLGCIRWHLNINRSRETYNKSQRIRRKLKSQIN